MERNVWIKAAGSGPNGNCVEVLRTINDEFLVRNSRTPEIPALVYTAAEWDAFVGGVKDGEFDLQ